MLKFDQPTLVTLTAPTCSGKSTILNALTSRGCGRIVSTTTRAKRAGEVEGVDYRFINAVYSAELEAADAFFELIEFRGIRYGVTRGEMEGKMREEFAPVVILEPKGVAIYEQKCREHGWKMYKVYVATPESIRIQRLNARSASDILRFGDLTDKLARVGLERIIATHTDRLLSITSEERAWSNTNVWDAIVPGDNLEKALEMLVDGATWRNKRVAQGVA